MFDYVLLPHTRRSQNDTQLQILFSRIPTLRNSDAQKPVFGECGPPLLPPALYAGNSFGILEGFKKKHNARNFGMFYEHFGNLGEQFGVFIEAKSMIA